MKEKNLNERKARLLTIIAVVLLLVIVIGAAYAYFQAQVGNGTNTSINATTGTTDVLTFSMQDLDASNEEKNVTDENSDEDIIINANADNFGEKGNSLADGVKAIANLKANDATNTASAKYDVYFVIENNELIYTQEGNTPELLLNVQMPNGEEKKELTTLDNLQYYSNTNNFSGFDITNKENIAIPIYKGYEIKVTEGEEETQEWDITVTLINLDKDQNKNTGKKLEGKVLLTKELPEGADLKLAHISSLSNTTITTDSITTTLNFDEEGTNDIEEYYYGYKEIGVAKTRTIDGEGITWSEAQDTATYTFNGLNTNSQYEIYAYTVDGLGLKSNRYETEITVSEGKLPEIENVKVTEKSYDSISIEVTPKTEEENPITTYEYQIKTNGEVIKTQTKSETTYTFNDLKELTEYEIIVKAISSDEKESVEYKIKEMTLKQICKDNETIEQCLTRIDKEQNPEIPTLLHHDGQEDYEGEENFELEAGDDSYRYSGANASVNNYICLDGKRTGTICEDEDLYRIIGLFKNEQEEYEIKVIKSSPATNTQLGTNGAYKADSENTYYWNKNQNDSGTNTNKWGESNLNKVNLNTTFKADIEKKIGANKIAEHEWIVGGNTSSNITLTANMKTVYTNEITSEQAISDKVTNTKIGLMYASDYGYAASPTNWTTQLYNYNSSTVTTNNWMYMNNNTTEWTISRNSDSSYNAFNVNSAGYVSGYNYVYSNAYAARPVFYLASSVTIASGNGSTTAPYRVSLTDGQF